MFLLSQQNSNLRYIIELLAVEDFIEERQPIKESVYPRCYHRDVNHIIFVHNSEKQKKQQSGVNTKPAHVTFIKVYIYIYMLKLIVLCVKIETKILNVKQVQNYETYLWTTPFEKFG